MPQEVDLSIIAPAYNEEDNIAPLIARIRAVFEPWAAEHRATFEAVIVDDGSTDGTRDTLLQLAAQHPWLRVIRLTPNSGQTAAMDAGFRAARGRFYGTVDADMQNDPGEIPRLLEIMHEKNVDMVNGWRQKRSDHFLRLIQSRIANGIRNRLSGDDIQDTGCSLKVYKREVLEGLTLYRGLHRFFPTLARMRGFKVIEVPVSHNQRLHGVTKYKFGSRVIRAFVDLLAIRWMKKRMLRYTAAELRPAEAQAASAAH